MYPVVVLVQSLERQAEIHEGTAAMDAFSLEDLFYSCAVQVRGC